MRDQDSKNKRYSIDQKSRLRIKRWWRTTGLAFVLVTLILFSSITIAQALVAGQGFMWTVWQSEPVKLVVCWMNPDAADPLPGESDQTPGWQRREWVRLALKRTWEREARIIFVGWGTCQNEGSPASPPYSYGPRRPGTADENIKIEITTTGGGQNPGHGSWGDYMQNGIKLNLHNSSKAWYEYLAVHEFGHALGLYHGEERSDWPVIPGCPKQDYPPTPPWWPIAVMELLWGAPDEDSIMAYCSGGPNALSPTDVAGIQSSYERHLPGTLLSLPGSLCLASHANHPNGDPVFGWECDEAYDDQEWRFDADKQALYIKWPLVIDSPRRCLDVDTNNYTDVQTWDCHYGSNQQWKFREVMVRGYGGLCLTRPVTGYGALTMQTCSGTARQLWNVEKGQITGRVRLVSTSGNLCLTKDGGAGSDALAVPCTMKFNFLPFLKVPISRSSTADTPTTAGPNYTPDGVANWVRDFYLAEGGSITVPSRTQSMCLDVHDVWNSQFITGQGGPALGQRVQFFDCYDAQINQKWSFSGHLVSGNKCLTLTGNVTANGSKAEVAACTTATQQDWDYDW